MPYTETVTWALKIPSGDFCAYNFYKSKSGLFVAYFDKFVTIVVPVRFSVYSAKSNMPFFLALGVSYPSLRAGFISKGLKLCHILKL